MKDLLLKGDRRTLAKAITLIESNHPQHIEEARNLLREIMPHTGNSLRIGISGVPGVGKSSFIEKLGLNLIEENHKVAVLAVDPSSPVHGGSILGDKTRMEKLATKSQGFIRPSPTQGGLGGVAKKTRECILLCEAAGYDIILIETVGVGQSEIEVHSMTDFFLMLMLPGAGDELQGIKKGVLELADTIAINKAEEANKNTAEIAKQHYENALHLVDREYFWKPKVLTCSALENYNIDTIWSEVKDFIKSSKEKKHFEKKRKKDQQKWLESIIDESLLLKARSSQTWAQEFNKLDNDQEDVFTCAENVIKNLLGNKHGK